MNFRDSNPIDVVPSEAKQVPAARRALDIIELVAQERQLKHTDIADRLGIPKSSATLILDTLVRSGYLQRDPLSRAYSVGSRILAIAGRYLSDMDIVQISQPVLSRLVVDVDESAFLVHAEGDEVVVLWREVCKRRLNYTFALGERAPIALTAGGLALLAMRPATGWRRTLAACGLGDEKTLCRLVAELEAIADGAMATMSQGHVQEVSSFALPIVSAQGAPVAAVSMAIPAQRMNAALQQRVEHALRRAQREIAPQVGLAGLHSPRA